MSSSRESKLRAFGAKLRGLLTSYQHDDEFDDDTSAARGFREVIVVDALEVAAGRSSQGKMGGRLE